MIIPHKIQHQTFQRLVELTNYEAFVYNGCQDTSYVLCAELCSKAIEF
jgi:hypothetical protein